MAVNKNKEDAATVGRAIYEEKILPKLGPDDQGKVVVIDVNSGDYEIADQHMTAATRLRERQPEAYTWAERVGFPTVHRMPFRFTYGSLPINEMKRRRQERHDQGQSGDSDGAAGTGPAMTAHTDLHREE